MRTVHRWVSLAFTLVSAAIFVALAAGAAPGQWVYALPLPFLAVLVATGLYLFALPYVRRSRRP